MQKGIIILILVSMLVIVSGVAYSLYRSESIPFFLSPEDSINARLVSTYDPETGTTSIDAQLPEKPSPYSRISADQIEVYEDKVIINIKNPEWATFADTNSMDPVIDYGSFSIEIRPETEQDIYIGDIIAYTDKDNDSIIHRVIEISEDDDGWYCITKGDNASRPDSQRVRFEQITNVLVMIIY